MKTKRNFAVLMLIAAVSITLLSFELPDSWFVAGSEPKKYDMGIDKGAGPEGKNAATIRSKDKKINGFGTLMQQCLPGKYLGKKVRMSGLIKSQGVDDWAGLWFRVDSKSKSGISFDNMADRPVKGTTDWKRYEIVLEVPGESINLAYGALLAGTGQIWFTDLKFEVVDGDVDETAKTMNQTLKEPTNLDFRE